MGSLENISPIGEVYSKVIPSLLSFVLVACADAIPGNEMTNKIVSLSMTGM